MYTANTTTDISEISRLLLFATIHWDNGDYVIAPLKLTAATTFNQMYFVYLQSVLSLLESSTVSKKV